MKIHHIINSYSDKLGGAEILVRSIHKHLIQDDFKSSIFGLLKCSDDINDAQTANLETPYSFRAFSAIKNYCINNVSDQDIIHAHLFPANFFCSIIKILGFTNAKLITTEHSTYNRRRGKFWGKIIDKIIYKSYDHIISISNGTKKKLIEWLPETKNRIIVIKNGCTLKHKKPIIREKNKSTIKLVSVGALKTAKNYELTIKSIIHIKDLDFKWTIAGDGALRNKLNKEIEKLGLIDKIKFIGRVDPIWPLLEQSDIFIITSIWEGFGMAAVEAMNSTLPIVASDIPGLKEIVGFEESKCALFVNPLDDYDISNKIKELILSHDLRIKLGINGFSLSNNFKISKMLNEYTKLYKNLKKAHN